MPSLLTRTYDEPFNVTDFLKFELSQEYCRDNAVIASGQSAVLDVGAVLDKVPGGAAVSAVKASGANTGNGTNVPDATTPLLAGAKPGVYRLRFTTTTNIRLEDPEGVVIADIAIGGSTGNSVTISEQIKTVVTQGATPFAAGDGFDVTVTPNPATTKWTAHVDGGVAEGILLNKVDATAADRSAVVLSNGPAIVSRLGLKWHSTIDSEAKKDRAVVQLRALGIKTHLSA